MDCPPLTLIGHKDIQIFPGPIAFVANPFYCSSLEGKRTIADVFDILDNAVAVGTWNAFVLQGIDDRGAFLSTVYRRGASGTFKPGKYVIVPQENGVAVLRKEPQSFAAGLEEPPLKRAKVSDTENEGSSVSTRDDGSRDFKMRLVYRDKGCVVCHAEGTGSIYQYDDDSQFFEGSHIFPFAKQLAWTLRGYQSLIADPYTATRTENATHNTLRINSLENGILLCLAHHEAFRTFRFSIHPTTHKIFAFHPAVNRLHGLEVTSPWKEPNPMYPSPHHELLRAHIQTSIFASLSAAAEPLGDNVDEEEAEAEAEDYELPDISDHHEAVGIWASDTRPYN